MSSDQHVKNDAGLQDSLSTCATWGKKKTPLRVRASTQKTQLPACLEAGILLTPDTKLKTHLVDSDRFISPPMIWNNLKQ